MKQRLHLADKTAAAPHSLSWVCVNASHETLLKTTRTMWPYADTLHRGGFLGDLFVQYMFRVLAHKGLYSTLQYSTLITSMWAYAGEEGFYTC